MVSLKTRILVADYHAHLRRGLRLMLDAEPDLEVPAEAGDGVEAVQRGLQDEIDLAIIDVVMPGVTGLQAGRELHCRRPKLRILFLSMHDNEQHVYEAFNAGAYGYVRVGCRPGPGGRLPRGDAWRAVALHRCDDPGDRRLLAPRAQPPGRAKIRSVLASRRW